MFGQGFSNGENEVVSGETQLLVADGGYNSGRDGRSQPYMVVLMVA